MMIDTRLFLVIASRWTGAVSAELRAAIAESAKQHTEQIASEAKQLKVDDTLPSHQEAIFGETPDDDDDGFI